ncbi:MAG: ribonuclease P protein component [Betaproteobacteria bacterium]
MGLARARRLREPAQFAAAGKGRAALRVAGTWFALAAVAQAPAAAPDAPLRFGWIVPKRYARRAVDRNLVKRILRESARPAAAALDTAAGAPLDVIVRLRATVPPVAAAARAGLRRAWRADADALFAALTRRLLARPRA